MPAVDLDVHAAAPAQAPPNTAVEPLTFQSPLAAGISADGPLPLGPELAATKPGNASALSLQPLGDWTVLAAIGAAFALVGIFRLKSLRRAKSLPNDVFELLGEASLGGQQAVRVIRFGPRTLLVGISSSGCKTLAELDDPQTTERIAAACRGAERSPRGPGRISPPVTVPRSPTPGQEAI